VTEFSEGLPKADPNAKKRHSMADGDLREPVDLPEYLEGVGELLRLQSREGEQGRAGDEAARTAPDRATGRRRRHAVVLLGAAAIAIFVLVRVLHLGTERTLPVALEGTWRTDAEAYAGRTLEITPSTLSFRVGDVAATGGRYRIVRVRRSTVAEGTLFRVDYLQGGNPLEFSFVWRASPQPEIRFENQKNLVWTRSGPVDSTGPTDGSAR
jgi:hypothetical protein